MFFAGLERPEDFTFEKTSTPEGDIEIPVRAAGSFPGHQEVSPNTSA
jgi:hypothetical protein